MALATVAILLMANTLLSHSQGRQENALLLVKKLSYTWDDVREDLKITLNTSVTQNGENLSIGDFLPAPKNVTRSLEGYRMFVEKYYRTADLGISYVDSSGGAIALETLGTPLRILPYGINYSYPDQSKQQLDIDIPEENFSSLRQMNMTIHIPDRWFKEYPFSDVCNIWAPLKTCTAGTDNCLTFWVNVIDRNSTSYNNSASCSQFDVDKTSTLTLNLDNETSQNSWVRIRVGQLPGNLVEIDLQNAAIATNLTFTLNSSTYLLNYAAGLAVRDESFNSSKTYVISP